MLRHTTLKGLPMNPVLKQFDLSGRVALITGSSAGIGLALAQGLAGAGAAVVLNARNPAKLEAAAMALREQGATVHAMAFDVTDAKAVAERGGAHRGARSGRSTSWSTTRACRSARRCRTSSRPTGSS